MVGAIICNIIKLSPKTQDGIKFAEKNLLSYAVLLMGFSLKGAMLSSLGIKSLSFIILIVAFSVFVSFIAGRLLNMQTSLCILLGLGNAICGSSAIAASAPLLSKNKEEVGIAVSVVNLLGIFGIFFLPILVEQLAFQDQQASLLVGGTLQAVGHVLAAGHTINEKVGDLSLAVKMGRICLLAPVLLLIAWQTQKVADSGTGTSWIKKMPNYLYGFILCAILGNLNLLSLATLNMIKSTSHILLLLAMAGIGLQIRLGSLIRQGPKALLLGGLTFILQIVALSSLLFFL